MKLSIITVNRNNAVGLEKTIRSVISQDDKNFEYIIIDGSSTDNSVDVIKKYESGITYWISEKDTGIYNAMNKGINSSHGDYCLFLNSGDNLYDSGITRFFNSMEYKDDIIFGDLLINDACSERVLHFPDKIDAKYIFNSYLPHPSSFIKRTILNSLGQYDEKIKISSDHDFFLRALVCKNASYIHVQKVISVFYYDGISSDKNNQRKINDERTDSFKRNLPMFYSQYQYWSSLENDSVIQYVIRKRNNQLLRFFLKILRKTIK